MEAEPFQLLLRYFVLFSCIVNGAKGGEIIPFKVYWDPDMEEISIDKSYSYCKGSYIWGAMFGEEDKLVVPGFYIWGERLDRGRNQRIEQTLIGSSFETFVTASRQVEHHFPTFLVMYLHGKLCQVTLWEEWGIIKHYQIREIPYLQTSCEEREAARIKREDCLLEYYTSRNSLTLVDRERLNGAGEILVPTVVLDRSVLQPESWIEESITYLIKG